MFANSQSQEKRIKFVFGGIEALTLNFALQPRFWQYLVQATPPVSDIQQSTLITFFIYYLTVKIE
jgi:hypothetical protein